MGFTDLLSDFMFRIQMSKYNHIVDDLPVVLNFVNCLAQ